MTPERKEALIADAGRQTDKLMRERLDARGEASMTVDAPRIGQVVEVLRGAEPGRRH